MSYDCLFSVIIVGDEQTGKSSILSRFTNNEFSEGYISTIAPDFRTKDVEVGDKAVKLQIWDTAGQERFRSITRSYYHGASCIMIAFDVTNRNSFLNVERWVEESNPPRSSDDAIRILIGNKIDLAREVTREEAHEYAEGKGLLYLECSAKDGTNVDSAFLEIAQQLIGRNHHGIADINERNTFMLKNSEVKSCSVQ
eukprot:TRINITY_DN14_c0_g1_i10.p1 TRINITY_DN14_c0_g1~~TRINITY_DN14_c0_g1_i10.p1  ORF type:complete len:205 (-),score=38.77 TRINITY_DN14_c0_g1_i10:44-634(-)